MPSTAMSAENKELLAFKDSQWGRTLLAWAVLTNRYDACEALLEAGADPNVPSYGDSLNFILDGTTPFILAADKQETSDYVRLLLEYGGDVNTIPKLKEGEGRGWKTPLIAAAWGNLESVKILVEAGADINFRERNETALRTAYLGGQIEIILYLLQQGAEFRDPMSKTSEGGTLYISDLLRLMPYDLNSDKYKVKMEVVEFLKEHGIDYRDAPIPKRYYDMYSDEYLEKY